MLRLTITIFILASILVVQPAASVEFDYRDLYRRLNDTSITLQNAVLDITTDKNGNAVDLEVVMPQMEVRVPGSEVAVCFDSEGRCTINIANAHLHADKIIARGKPHRTITLEGRVELLLNNKTMNADSCTISLGDDTCENPDSTSTESTN